ncbi:MULTISPECIES: hypothetical protein [unclassified Paenibacillus]|uniref:hypothetical protein n=1 Tax=unclassified Paenibacillus TaxID=185978 RepID=UPI0024B9E176|nr:MULTISPECIES: hypothetical protein [unclassified Paenibacillus]
MEQKRFKDESLSVSGMNEWVFTNLERFQSNPVNTTYYIIPEEELWELEDAGLTVTNHRDESIPASLPDHHAQTWLEIATVQDVIEVLPQRQRAGHPPHRTGTSVLP